MSTDFDNDDNNNKNLVLVDESEIIFDRFSFEQKQNRSIKLQTVVAMMRGVEQNKCIIFKFTKVIRYVADDICSL